MPGMRSPNFVSRAMSSPPDSPKKNQQRRILAFDFGTKRIGVAVGQELTGSATPLAPLAANNGIPDWDLLKVLVDQWQPDAFVVGIPLNMDSSNSDMAIRARKFCKRLHGRFHKPSYGMDERLSSFAAKSEIAAAPKTTNTSIDSMAAKLILESWFQQNIIDKENNGDPCPS